MTGWTVYILQCADGSLYTGITTNLERRLDEHNTGKRPAAAYTRSRLPVRLVYQEEVKDRSLAQKREAEIRQLNRQEKLALLQSVRTGKV